MSISQYFSPSEAIIPMGNPETFHHWETPAPHGAGGIDAVPGQQTTRRLTRCYHPLPDLRLAGRGRKRC